MLAACMIFCFAIYSFYGEICAETVSNELHIRATVPIQIDYEILKNPEFIEINKANKKRGYLDVEKGTELKVTTNNPSGYVILLTCEEADFFTYAMVKDGDRVFELFPGSQLEIHEPLPIQPPDKKSLDYTFYLTPDVQLIKYPWPISVIVYSF
jgi:hypothetical protein